jgi:hypothetical protein
VDAAGKLTIDWPVLDAELDRLDHRGRILFHLNHPPIEFAVPKSDAEKRPSERVFAACVITCANTVRLRRLRFTSSTNRDWTTGRTSPSCSMREIFPRGGPKLLTYTDRVADLSWKDFGESNRWWTCGR